jgi:hypothetical protein
LEFCGAYNESEKHNIKSLAMLVQPQVVWLINISALATTMYTNVLLLVTTAPNIYPRTNLESNKVNGFPTPQKTELKLTEIVPPPLWERVGIPDGTTRRERETL